MCAEYGNSSYRAFTDRVAGFLNDENMIGVHRMYSNNLSIVLSQSFDRGSSVAGHEKLCRKVCLFKHKAVNMCLRVCTSELFTLRFHLFDYLIEDVSRFVNISALDASPCK